MGKAINNKTNSTAKKKIAKKNQTALEKKEFTDDEKARIAKYEDRATNMPVKMRTIENDVGNLEIEWYDSNNPLEFVKMFEAFGTTERVLQTHFLGQVLQTFTGGLDKDTEKAVETVNRTFALLSGIQPQDELEAMLAVQMIGIHNMSMDLLRRAADADRVDYRQNYINGATKLSRTYMAQMDVLKKYRTGGQQKMTVEHVHVNKGGQAIVGTVNQGGGKKQKE